MDQILKSKLEAAGITSEGFELLEQYMTDKLTEQHNIISEAFEKEKATLREAYVLRKADQMIGARVMKENAAHRNHIMRERAARNQALTEEANKIYTQRCIKEAVNKAFIEEGVDYRQFIRLTHAMREVQNALVECDMSPSSRATVHKYRTQVASLQEELRRTEKERHELQEKFEQFNLRKIFEENTKDLPLSKKEKVRSIMETVEFKDFDEFANILDRVCESVGRVETQTTIKEESKPDATGRMAEYLQYL